MATSEDQAKTSFEDVLNILETPKFARKLKSFYKSKILIKHIKQSLSLNLIRQMLVRKMVSEVELLYLMSYMSMRTIRI